ADRASALVLRHYLSPLSSDRPPEHLDGRSISLSASGGCRLGGGHDRRKDRWRRTILGCWRIDGACSSLRTHDARAVTGLAKLARALARYGEKISHALLCLEQSRPGPIGCGRCGRGDLLL